MSRFRRALRRAGVGLGIAVPVLLIAGEVWYRGHYILPPVEQPKRQIPAPNGFDTLQAACRLQAKNEKAAAIRKVRESLGQEYLDMLEGHDSGSHKSFRDLVRLLVQEAKTNAAAGNLGEAGCCVVDAIALGHQVPRGGGYLTGAAGIYSQEMGQKAALALLPQLDAPAARAAALRLEALDAARYPLKQTLQQMKRELRGEFVTIYEGGPVGTWQQGLKRIGLVPDMSSLTAQQRLQALWFQTKVTFYGPRTTLEDLSRLMDDSAARSEQAWRPRQKSAWAPDNPISALVTLRFEQMEYEWRTHRMFAQLLLAHLALRAYHLEQGSLPQRLEQLVSKGYLTHLPDDPFSPTHAPLGYRAGKVWSVGPDGKDDGGAPMPLKGYGRFVDPKKTGDIVE